MSAAERALAALKRSHAHVSFAESLTGGLIAATLISLSGASEVINESYVTYSPEAKIRLVHVNPETPEREGVVSARCAAEMAEGVRKVSGAQWGASATGLAGPGGGTKATPVGTVFIAVAGGDQTRVRELHLSGSRGEIRQRTAEEVLGLLADTTEQKGACL